MSDTSMAADMASATSRGRGWPGQPPPCPSREGACRRRSCFACSPGCRRRFRPAPTPIRTAWNGRWNAATSPTATRLRAWLADVLIARLRPQRRDPAAPRAPRRAAIRTRSAKSPTSPPPSRRRANAATETLGSGHGLPRRRRRVASAATCPPTRRLPGRRRRAGRRGMASPKTRPPPPTCRPSPPT